MQQAQRQRIWPAILTLYVLAAIIPECVATYNTAPRSFLFNPATFFFETACYGSANLLIRELMRRRARSWASFILLGAAFGFVNEGIVAGTWYNVVPVGYTLIGGVDWGWATALTTFHTLYSVVIPILLVETLFPDLAAQPWLRRRGLIISALLLTLTTSLGFFSPVDRLARLLVLLAVVVLVGIALLLPQPARAAQISRSAALGMVKLHIAGFVGTLLFFGAIILAPAILIHIIPLTWHNPAQLFDILLIVAVGLFLLNTVRRWRRSDDSWKPRQTLALITGALLPTILLSLFLPQMWLAAQPVATLFCLGILLWSARRMHLRQTLPIWRRSTVKLTEI